MNKKVMVSELMYSKIKEAYNQSIKEEYTEEDKERFFNVYSENIKKALEKRDFNLVKANAYFLCKVFGCEDSDSVINEYNKEVMANMEKKYGKEKAKAVYYATANKYGYDPETFKKK